jgi:hypothetical protein
MINLLSLTAIVAAASNPFQKNEIYVPNAAFSYLIHDSLYISTFAVFKDDKVMFIPKTRLLDSSANNSPVSIPGKITWPNGIKEASTEIFGQKGIVAAGGFLTPGKGNGGLWFSPLYDGEHGELIKIHSGRNYFYHQIEYYDVNQDGKLDIITCRATKPLLGSGNGDLVWLEPKNRANPTGPWVEKVIGKGCDVHFKLVDINQDGKPEIISAEFWRKKISLIESDKNGRFDNYSALKITTIDDKIGSAFDIDFVDINGDGKMDILATNHEAKEDESAVVGYELVDGKWVKHILARGFKTLQPGIGQASPGGAKVFKPEKNSMPTIVLSGDGSQKAYILAPTSTTVSDWKFERTLLHDCKCTVGYISVGDTDNDGKSEIYIPCYDSHYVAVYSY